MDESDEDDSQHDDPEDDDDDATVDDVDHDDSLDDEDDDSDDFGADDYYYDDCYNDHDYDDDWGMKMIIMTRMINCDLMYLDEKCYLYFADRLGDTFRWRGENVSTSEVESVVNLVVTNQSNVVYGVNVPGIEGRAGMLALAVNWNELSEEKESILIDNLTKAFNSQLPSYARPVFIRLRGELDTTGTFKLRKVNLVKEGFSVHMKDDHLYYCEPKSKTYQRLDEKAFEEIQKGIIRL
ncbi:unnamed protein product [Echinostoma caproni]|uniref:AMP-binding_C domain-containing protein n=1 Tax=Echinostoma caproni TaxID=27848 RepID=A0A3P8HWJ4_9TREM|nr:unnamed protein product [Echinostoma caproni]